MTTSTAESDWLPPGKNCGACGCRSCSDFTEKMRAGTVTPDKCIFYRPGEMAVPVIDRTVYSGKDITGQEYDFILEPLPGEPSARKIVLPFRPDIVDKLDIVRGDIVTGRPAGAGCPVQHVIKVLECDRLTGVITGFVVGPAYSRGKEVKDVSMYHMLGFEGKARVVRKEPGFGLRQPFLPGSCMMDRAHTGLVNMVIRKPWGIHVRVEDIVIM